MKYLDRAKLKNKTKIKFTAKEEKECSVAVKIFSTNVQKNFEEQQKELDLLKKLQKFNNIVKIQQYMLEIEDEHTYQIFIIMEIAEKTLQDEIIERGSGN